MAYIGNRPVSGDNNSFRVLDDIKTHTFSFDGSSSSVVSTSDNTITHLGHRLVQGQRVTYTDGTGSAIGGLTDGTVYFVIINDANSFKLASSASNAAAGTAINLTSVGSGTSHNINVAFDGVNTKFKATFNNGTEADVTRVAQIQISLNNVIQQPQNTPTPTSGFGFESDSVIVFASAPASSVTFWGVLFANNFPTFEISDNDVDNFTGNGSTTDFTLSKSPAANENIIVTIDGVVQYPSDNSTTRAYNTVGNTLQFSVAPHSDSDIQVRHIGFAGPDESGGVAAFYGRTGSVFLNSSDNIVVNDAEVTGNLTVQGSMTTLDTKVTEVDQLEVAANNTTVGVAITQSGSGDILNLYDGSTEVFTVEDGGNVGIGTNNPGSLLHLQGTGGSTSGLTIKNSAGKNVTFYLNNDTSSSQFSINFGGTGGSDIQLHNSGNVFLAPNQTGNIGIATYTADSRLSVNGDVKITGIVTASSFVGGLPITNGADNRVITATSASAIQGEAGLTFDGSTLLNAGSGFKGITIAPNTNNSATLRLQNSARNFSISNITGGTFSIADGSDARLTIDGSGNVGVGTNGISTRFEIEGTAALTNHDQTLFIRDSVADDATGRGGNIGFGAYVDGTMRTLAAIGAFKKNSGTGFDGHLALYTRRNGVGPVDEVMRLESGGNVGINQTSPYYKLHLNFTDNTTSLSGGGAGNWGGNGIRIENDSTTTGAMALIHFRSHSTDWHIGNKKVTASPDKSDFVFLHEGTEEKLRIVSDGEVRIADGGKITINTSVSGNYALQEALRIDDGNSTADRGLQIFEYHNNGVRWHSYNENLHVTTTGTSYTYTQGNYGGSNMIEMINGDLKIYNNSEVVSAGTSAITPTERIRVRSDGKVLIGSVLGANPYDDRKLTINSASNNYLSIQSGSSSFSGIVFGHASGQTTDNFLTYVRHNNADNKFAIHTNSSSTPKVVITPAGNVGIGTINPESKFTIWADDSDTNEDIFQIRGKTGAFNIRVNDADASNPEWAIRTYSQEPILFMQGTQEKARFNPDGRFLVSRSGLTASRNVGTKTGEIQIASSGNSSAFTMIGFSNDAAAPHLMFGKSRAGNATGSTIVHDGDRLGEIAFCGADGTDIDSFGAAIKAFVDGTPGANDMPGRLSFFTTLDGYSSSTERMVIKNDGKVGIGITNPNDILTLADPGIGNIVSLRIVDPTASTYGAHFSFYDTPNEVRIGGVSNGAKRAVIRIDRDAPSDVLTVTDTGNIGIGTDITPHKLSVKGTISKIAGTSGIQLVNIANDSSQNGTIAIMQSGGVERIKLHSSGVSYFNGGNVGINSTSPATKLDVRLGAAWIYPDDDGTEAVALKLGKLRDFNSSLNDILVADNDNSTTPTYRVTNKINRYIANWHFDRSDPTGRINAFQFRSAIDGTSLGNRFIIRDRHDTIDSVKLWSEGDSFIGVSTAGATINVGIGTNNPGFNQGVVDNNSNAVTYNSKLNVYENKNSHDGVLTIENAADYGAQPTSNLDFRKNGNALSLRGRGSDLSIFAIQKSIASATYQQFVTKPIARFQRGNGVNPTAKLGLGGEEGSNTPYTPPDPAAFSIFSEGSGNLDSMTFHLSMDNRNNYNVYGTAATGYMSLGANMYKDNSNNSNPGKRGGGPNNLGWSKGNAFNPGSAIAFKGMLIDGGTNNDEYGEIQFWVANQRGTSSSDSTWNAKQVAMMDENGVGIGTVAPDELLHIFSESSHSKIVLEADNNSANNGIFWVDEGVTTQSEFYYSHPDNKQFLKVNGNGFEVYSKQTSKVTAKIGHSLGYNDVVVPNGNLGIGTDDADQTLDVIGDAAIEGTLFLSDVGGQIVKMNGTGGNLDIFSDGTIDFIESDANKTMVTFDVNTVHDDARIYLEGDVDTYLNHPDSNQLGFTIGATETMRLRAGKVGIKTDNPAAAFHVETAVNESTIAIFGSTDNTSASTYQALAIRNNMAGYPALANNSSTDVLELRSAGSTQITIDGNNNDTGKFFRVSANGNADTGTELFRIDETGLTTLKNFNGTGLRLQGSGSDYQGMQLQITDASASQTRNVFIDAVNENGNAVANMVGAVQADGGSKWLWQTQAVGDRTDRRVSRVDINPDGEVGINSVSANGSTTITDGTAVVKFGGFATNSLPANAVGGITVKVGDEEVSGNITLPRNGHIMVITGFSDAGGTSYPQPQASGMFYIDVGPSKLIRPMYTQGGTGADDTTNVGHSLVGKTSTAGVSDCDDNKITIMPGSGNGTIRICNRESNSAFVFYLTFL